MAELVTGEAVALDIRVARLASRGCAFLLDLIFQMVMLYIVIYVTAMTSLVADDAWTVGLSLLGTVAVLVGYPCVFETLLRGRTLGKMAVGLRVVGDDGGPVRFRQALVRALAGVIEFWTFYGSPALITSFCNRRGKRLGDLFAGTIVIQERALDNRPRLRARIRSRGHSDRGLQHLLQARASIRLQRPEVYGLHRKMDGWRELTGSFYGMTRRILVTGCPAP